MRNYSRETFNQAHFEKTQRPYDLEFAVIDLTPRLEIPEQLRARAVKFGVSTAADISRTPSRSDSTILYSVEIRTMCRRWAAEERDAFPQPKKRNVGVWLTSGLGMWFLALQGGSTGLTGIFMLLGALSLVIWFNMAFNRTLGPKSPTTRRIQIDRALVEVEVIAVSAALAWLVGHPES